MNKGKDIAIQALKKVLHRENISREESREVFKVILDHELGIANDVTFGALFASLQTKGPTEDEILGLMDVVMDYDRRNVLVKSDVPILGIVGSGKDDLKTFNISTGASLLAASLGCKVVKNGSRSESSVSGTTDVLEELGVNISMSDDQTQKTLDKVNITFCDAEPYFPRMGKEYVGKFLFAHPLSYILSIASGVKLNKIVFGISFPETEKVASLLDKMGYDEYIVVYGSDLEGKSLDEFSTIGPSQVTEKIKGVKRTYNFEFKDLNNGTWDKYEEVAQRSSVSESALFLKQVLSGENRDSAQRIVALNAASLLYLDGKTDSLESGYQIAIKALNNATAISTLDNLIGLSNE
jgi:anthranilate phosphoribosyltransferase